MASLEQLKHTFFDECAEGMQQIEQGLSDIRDGLGGDDTVNAVFRAVHSAKGGERASSASKGWSALLTSLKPRWMRSGAAIWPRPTDVIDVLLMSSDILSDLVQFSRAGDAIPGRLRRRMPPRAWNA